MSRSEDFQMSAIKAAQNARAEGIASCKAPVWLKRTST